MEINRFQTAIVCVVVSPVVVLLSLFNGITVDVQHFKVLNDFEYQGVLIGSVVAGVPLLLDFFMDMFLGISRKSAGEQKLIKAKFCIIVTTVDFLILAVILPLKLYSCLVALTCTRDSLVIITFLKTFYRSNSRIVRVQFLVLFGVSVCACNVLQLLAILSPDYKSLIFYINCGTIGLSSIVLVCNYIHCALQSDEAKKTHWYAAAICTFLIVDWYLPFVMESLSHGPHWTRLCGVHYLSTYTAWTVLMTVAVHVLSLRSDRQEADVAMETLSSNNTFIRHISHEIRTPLNVVMSGLKVLEENIYDDVPAEVMIETILDTRGSCVIAVDTVSEMLAFDKMKQGLMTLEMTTFEINSFFTDCMRPFRLQAIGAGVRLVITFDALAEDCRSEVCADANKLAQVIRNLLSNALKFTPKDGTVSVHISCDRESRALCMTVQDSGPGISKANQEKLFKSVVQFDAGKLQKGGGTGLGLLISKGIVDLHSGYIKVHSAGEDAGCTFTVSIPLNCETTLALSPKINVKSDNFSSLGASATDMSDAYRSIVEVGGSCDDSCTPVRTQDTACRQRLSIGSAHQPIRRAGPSGGRKRASRHWRIHVSSPDEVGCAEESGVPMNVGSSDGDRVSHMEEDNVSVALARLRRMLIVDDSAASRKMLMRLVSRRSDAWDEACDGLEAVDKVTRSMKSGHRELQYGLILIDYHMPCLDGPSTCKALRGMCYEGLLIGLTGDTEEEHVNHFLVEGADHVLSKPIDVDTLDAIIKSKVSDILRSQH